MNFYNSDIHPTTRDRITLSDKSDPILRRIAIPVLRFTTSELIVTEHANGISSPEWRSKAEFQMSLSTCTIDQLQSQLFLYKTDYSCCNHDERYRDAIRTILPLTPVTALAPTSIVYQSVTGRRQAEVQGER